MTEENFKKITDKILELFEETYELGKIEGMEIIQDLMKGKKEIKHE